MRRPPRVRNHPWTHGEVEDVLKVAKSRGLGANLFLGTGTGQARAGGGGALGPRGLGPLGVPSGQP